MPMYFIGLGLGDEKDVTIKGMDAIKRSSRVYLEAYTSVLGGQLNKERLEKFYGCEVVVADRQMVEEKADELMPRDPDEHVAFLVIGDPFGATTHTDLMMRAKAASVEVVVVHNASIMNAVGCCGLQLYTYGQSVSICFFTETWRPDSFYEKVAVNRREGLHTLCLLDIKVKEPNLEALARGKMVYEPPRYMTINTCISQMLEVEQKHKAAGTGGAYDEDTLCVGVACVGCDNQRIVAGTMGQLLHVDFGPPLHSMVLCGELHECELEVLNAYRVPSTPPLMPKSTEGDAIPLQQVARWPTSLDSDSSAAILDSVLRSCCDPDRLRQVIGSASDRLVELSRRAGRDQCPPPAPEQSETSVPARTSVISQALGQDAMSSATASHTLVHSSLPRKDSGLQGGAEIAFEGDAENVNEFLGDLIDSSDD